MPSQPQPQPPRADWQSSEIPSSIRRPWEVFEYDLEDQSEDLSITERITVFSTLAVADQRVYAEASLTELAAFARWRAAKITEAGGETQAMDVHSQWELLDRDVMISWVPECPRAVLSCDTRWASLLADGPPPCGPIGDHGADGDDHGGEGL